LLTGLAEKEPALTPDQIAEATTLGAVGQIPRAVPQLREFQDHNAQATVRGWIAPLSSVFQAVVVPAREVAIAVVFEDHCDVLTWLRGLPRTRLWLLLLPAVVAACLILGEMTAWSANGVAGVTAICLGYLALPPMVVALIDWQVRVRGGNEVGHHPVVEGAPPASLAQGVYAPMMLLSRPEPIPRSPFQLPPDIGDFTGRSGDISSILTAVHDAAGGPVTIDLFGPPGVGKSALAVHVAHQLASQFDDAQLYVDAGATSSPLSERDILALFVNALAPAGGMLNAAVPELRARYQSALSALRCVVVIDNAQDEQQVRPLIPSSSQAVVLVTSRMPLATLAAVCLHRVQTLDKPDAIKLLTAVIGPQAREAADALDRIARACGGLPLALRIAGATAKKRSYLPLGHLADQLDQERQRLQLLKQGDLDVRSSFSLSYQALPSMERAAFRMTSLSPTAEFLVSDIAQLLGQPEAITHAALQQLVDAQLVETTDGITFRCHDLLALFAAELGENEEGSEARALARQGLMQVLADRFTEEYRAAWQGEHWQYAAWLEDWAYSLHSAEPDKLYVKQRLRLAGASAHDLTWEQAIALTPRMLIFGDPGTGKTTLGQRICYETGAKHRSSFELAFSVPLRQYSGRSDLDALIVMWVKYNTGLRLSAPVLASVLEQREVVIVFDSIDELPQATRLQCLHAIASFCASHPETAVIVTSRHDRRLQESGLEGFTQYSLCEFSDGEARGFALSCLDLHSADLVLRKEFTAQLRPPMTKWMHNPLLLTWMVATYQRNGYLPREEIELQRQIYEITLGSRDIYRRIRRSALTPREVSDGACFLAHWLKSSADRVAGVTENQLIEVLTTAFAYDAAEARELITLISDQLGMIYQSGIDADGKPLLSIVQDSFGEYLAARWTAMHSASTDEFVRDVITLVSMGRFDAGWRYAISLRAEQDTTIDEATLGSKLRAAAEHRALP
jgi:DNA polymerase III delta prime subunit